MYVAGSRRNTISETQLTRAFLDKQKRKKKNAVSKHRDRGPRRESTFPYGGRIRRTVWENPEYTGHPVKSRLFNFFYRLLLLRYRGVTGERGMVILKIKKTARYIKTILFPLITSNSDHAPEDRERSTPHDFRERDRHSRGAGARSGRDTKESWAGGRGQTRDSDLVPSNWKTIRNILF